jgi:hypothetical protein
VNSILLGYYTASSGNFLATFRGDLWGPIFKNDKKNMWILYLDSSPFKMGPRGRPETSVKNRQCMLHNNPEERNSHVVGSLHDL